MSYKINDAIAYCQLTTSKSRKEIRRDIIVALGGNPDNPSSGVSLSKKISGKTKGLTQPEFVAICKACKCPAYVLAGVGE